MLAGGSGVTPMVQLVRAILADPRDRTEIRLIVANKTRGDIMLKDELDALAAAHPQFSVVYTLDAPEEGWTVRAARGERGGGGRGGAAAGTLVFSRRPIPDPFPLSPSLLAPSQGERGFISESMIRKALPPPQAAGRVFVCGPPPMLKALSGEKKSPTDQGELTGLLRELGYDSAQVYKY